MKRRTSRKAAVRTKDRRINRRELAELGHLHQHLGYFLRRLQIWVFQDFLEVLSPMKVRTAQYSVLLVIEANPGRSQAAIGQTLNIERARLARLLHELVRRNWVVRRASGSDARSHSLYLTPQGNKALTKIKALAGKHEARLARFVGPARHKQLIELLREFG
jgi:DNA-binding MarR family transcriptional regulator